MRLKLFGVGFVAVLVWATPLLAKGPADQMTISGPGLAGMLTLTDRATLEAFGFGALEDYDGSRAGLPAPQVGAGYELTRYLKDAGGTLQAWDRLHYYPRPGATGGVIFYDGLLQNGSHTEFDGKWFAARPEGDAALRRLLGQHGVVFAALPATGGPLPADGWLLVAGGLLLGGIGVRYVGRRARATRAASTRH